MRAWYSDHYEVPLPQGHRFPMPKYRRLREALLEAGTLAPGDLVAAQPVERARLLTVHAAGYVDAWFAGRLDDAAVRRLGFPWSVALLERSRASAGGTLAAARHALATGFAGNLAGGTHHAHRDFGSGYCVFNDLALAAKTLLGEGRVQRVLVVDLDVHQGDGTAALCADDARLTTFSMHGEKNFPFRKQRSTLDVNLPDGCDDGTYLGLLDAHLGPVFERARPDLVLYQAGVDPLEHDTLGRLRVTFAGLEARDARVFELARARGVPLAMCLGGGYAKPLEATVQAHVNTWKQARRVFG